MNKKTSDKDKIIDILRKYGNGIPEGQIIVIANQIVKELALDGERTQVGD